MSNQNKFITDYHHQVVSQIANLVDGVIANNPEVLVKQDYEGIITGLNQSIDKANQSLKLYEKLTGAKPSLKSLAELSDLYHPDRNQFELALREAWVKTQNLALAGVKLKTSVLAEAVELDSATAKLINELIDSLEPDGHRVLGVKRIYPSQFAKELSMFWDAKAHQLLLKAADIEAIKEKAKEIAHPARLQKVLATELILAGATILYRDLEHTNISFDLKALLFPHFAQTKDSNLSDITKWETIL